MQHQCEVREHMERTAAAAVGGVGITRSALAFTALAGIASLAGVVTAAPTLCPVALLTGTPCPGCGMTRAIVALARGDLRASWTAHPLAGLVVAEAAVAVWSGVSRRLGRGARLSTRHLPLTAGATAAAFVVVWLVRHTFGALPGT
jgi:hypothetical protein